MRTNLSGYSILPPVVKNLLIINAIFFVARFTLKAALNIDMDDIFGLHYPFSSAFHFWQPITYMFMHGGMAHIFFNMFALWMFGSSVENLWGGRRFLIYYFVTGIGAAFLHYLVVWFQISPDIQLLQSFIDVPDMDHLQAVISGHRFIIESHSPDNIVTGFNGFKHAVDKLTLYPDNPEAMNTSLQFITDYLEAYKNGPNVIGASGSVFGILLAFGMLFPNTVLYMLFIPIPIKAKYFVIFYGVMELFLGLANSNSDNVAHFAHIGGMLFGFILIRWWRMKRYN